MPFMLLVEGRFSFQDVLSFWSLAFLEREELLSLLCLWFLESEVEFFEILGELFIALCKVRANSWKHDLFANYMLIKSVLSTKLSMYYGAPKNN